MKHSKEIQYKNMCSSLSTITNKGAYHSY